MISPQAWEQFLRSFSTVRYARPGREGHGSRTEVGSRALDTCEGTRARWDAVVRAGLVRWRTRSGRGPLGHSFSLELTDMGRAAIASGEKP